MSSKFRWIKLGKIDLYVEVMIDNNDLNIGMGKYQSPPKHAMLFIFSDNNNEMYITMNNVTFALNVLFFDKERNPLTIDGSNYWLRMMPNDNNKLMPKGTCYMIEFPVDTFS